jgi:hypothetical protein
MVKNKFKLFYVVSTKEKAEKNEYKLGKFLGTHQKLMSRYATYLINPILYYFIAHKKNNLIETIILSIFDDYRMINCNNHKTDWINLPLNAIVDVIDDTIKTVDKNSKNGNYYDDINDELIYPYDFIPKNKIKDIEPKDNEAHC